MWEFRDSGTNPLESTNMCPGTCPRILGVTESETELLFLSTKGVEAAFEKKGSNAETPKHRSSSEHTSPVTLAAISTARVDTRLRFFPGQPGFRQKAPSRSAGSRLLNASIFSCQRTNYKPFYPWGLGWSRRARTKFPGAPSLIPESHWNRRESMSCCRVAVTF